MTSIASVFLILCVLAIVVGLRVPGRVMIGVIGSTALVAFATWAIWSILLVSGVLRVDPLLHLFGAHRLEQPWAALLFLAPSVVVAIVFGAFATRRARARGLK